MVTFIKKLGREIYRSAIRTLCALAVLVIGGGAGLICFAFSWHVALIVLGVTVLLTLLIVGPVALRLLRTARTGTQIAVEFGGAVVQEARSRRQTHGDNPAALDQTADLEQRGYER